MLRKVAEGRLPTKHEFPREPGATLRNEIEANVLAAAIMMGVGIGIVGSAAAVVSQHIFFPNASVLAMVIVGVVLASLWGYATYRKVKPIVDRLHTGLHGERAVALVLKDLERQGFSVFHDVPSLKRPDEANIDHVVIGQTGVYAIETKTIRKRDGQHSLELTSETLTIDGKILPHNPIPQARAVADDLADILSRFAGEKCHIQAVVVLPGWYVTSKLKPWKQPVWVVNENALVTLITSPYRSALPDGMTRKLSGALQTHIRATNAVRK